MPSERLSSIDAAWLKMDGAANSADIGVLFLLEGRLELDALVDVVQQRLLRIPRFRQRVIASPMRWPRWEDDRRFSIAAHVRREDEEGIDLPTRIDALMSRPLPSDRPLWEAVLLETGDACSALFARIHHCVGDGYALARVLLSIAEPVEDGEPLSSPPLRSLRGDGPSDKSSWKRHDLQRRLDRQAWSLARSNAHHLLLPFDPPTLLRAPLSGERRVAWSDPLALSRLKRIGSGASA